MDQHNSSHWRDMFGDKHKERPSGAGAVNPLGGFDDGYDPTQRATSSDKPRQTLSPEEITDEAAMALALDPLEYKPWVLQRGRGRPAMMLHLRRHDSKSGLWIGWQVAYPQLIAAEYVGDKMLSLDFGGRQFVIEGSGLDELARHLQTGSVLVVQEHTAQIWPVPPTGAKIHSIRMLG